MQLGGFAVPFVLSVIVTFALLLLQVPTWSPQLMHAVPQAARISAQKFGTSMRLLWNIGMWKDVLAMPLLEELASARKSTVCQNFAPFTYPERHLIYTTRSQEQSGW
jgi:hypothetical protein